MGICERCGVSDQEVRLFDAIYNGMIGSLCERCSIIENVPIIKKPDSIQLKESEKGPGVYDRMKRLSGIKEERKDQTFFVEDKLEELDSHPELELPEKNKLNLIDHFHWVIMKNRRRKGLSPQQLAENIGESTVAVSMIEKAQLPENVEIIIKKLEQFFQVKLRKVSEIEKIMRQKKEKTGPVLLDEKGMEIEIIPEEEVKIFEEKESEEEVEEIGKEESAVNDMQDKNREIEAGKSEAECRIEQFDDEKRKMVCENVVSSEQTTSSEQSSEASGIVESPLEGVKELDLNKIDQSAVTIADLQELHKKKVEVTKQEQIEEQHKIEERKRILEALREQDRIKKEEKRRAEDLEKQRLSEEKQRLLEKRKEEVRQGQEAELGEIDKYLGGGELLGKDKKEFDDSEGPKEFDKELI